jgi:hypothetical protein
VRPTAAGSRPPRGVAVLPNADLRSSAEIRDSRRRFATTTPEREARPPQGWQPSERRGLRHPEDSSHRAATARSSSGTRLDGCRRAPSRECDDFERRFAEFVDKEAKDVLRFASLGTTEQGESGTQFRVDYLKPSGAIGFYHPDWVLVQKTPAGAVNWIIETKGRVWEGTADAVLRHGDPAHADRRDPGLVISVGVATTKPLHASVRAVRVARPMRPPLSGLISSRRCVAAASEVDQRTRSKVVAGGLKLNSCRTSSR